MNTRTTRQIATILNMHPSRIEQWISRGQFLPKIFAEKGLGREWTLDEAIRLALFVHLVDVVSMDPKVAGSLTQIGVHGFADANAFFVAHWVPMGGLSNWAGNIVRDRDLGTHLTSGCEYPKVLAAGHSPEIIAENSKPNLGPAHAAVIVDLDRIETDLRADWEA